MDATKDEQLEGHFQGNFPNYYQFNPPTERLQYFSSSFCTLVRDGVRSNRTLWCDVGCNSGNLTRDIWTKMQQEEKDTASLHMLGVDIDAKLIDRAIDSVKAHPRSSKVQFQVADIMTDDGKQVLEKYLASFDDAETQFDVISCFGLSMWIHLNHGDAGLFAFLDKIASLTTHLVIEPHPWKCYRNAYKRLRRLKVAKIPFQDIKIKHDVVDRIEAYLKQQCGFTRWRTLGQTKWKRKIMLFSKQPLPGIKYDEEKKRSI